KSVMNSSRILEQYLLSLKPATDAQKQILSTANLAAGQIEQTQLLMMLQLAGGISWPLLAIVVCWSLLLFCGYGLVSPVNATVVTALALGAIAVASALLIIIELSRPQGNRIWKDLREFAGLAGLRSDRFYLWRRESSLWRRYWNSLWHAGRN